MLSWLRKPLRPPEPTIPDGMRIYVVGDIHGCVDLLDDLHERIRNDLDRVQPAESQIIYLGDYVDRGPASTDVIDRLLDSPLKDMPAIHLKGNHEAMMMAFLKKPEQVGPKWFAIGGATTVASYGLPWRGGDDLPRLAQELAERLPTAHHDFLASLTPQYRVGEFIFVHAGVRPGVPLDHQVEADLLWIREPFLGSKAYHGAVVVHGHTPISRPEEFVNRISIDTGAFFTGILTCLVLEGAQRRYLATSK